MGRAYRRHFFLTVDILLLAFALLGVGFMMLIHNSTVQEKKSVLGDDAVYLSNVLSVALENGGSLSEDSLDNTLDFIAEVSNADVVICKMDGTVIFDYSGDPYESEDYDSLSGILNQLLDMVGLSNDSEKEGGSSEAAPASQISQDVLQAMEQEGRYEAMDTLGLYDTQHFVVGVPILVQEAPVGYVLVTVSMQNLYTLWNTFFVFYLVVALFVLALAIISSFVVTRHQARPLSEMTQIVRRFGLGEYNLRLNENTHDETVREMAIAFNAMADSIASTEQQRQEFVANISHELKTPMTNIQGFADGILDGTIPPERQPEALRTISDETRRLSRLVRRMLDASRLAVQGENVLCQTQFDIVETYAQVLISLERKITSKGLEVDVQFPDTPTKVWGDQDSITQVCYNLLDNAIKFATPGTVIVLGIAVKGNKAYVSVRDTGETIPKEELPLIFERFHKSDRSRSLDKDGVGLGLYIVKTIMNNHKESITVTSENGVTEFVFTLTMAE